MADVIDAREIVASFYALLKDGCFEEAFAHVAPDAVIREPAGLPFAGDYRGMAEIGQLLGLMGTVIDLGIDHYEIMASEAQFAVKLRSRFTPRDGRPALELDIVELVTVREGKIVDIDVFHKTPFAVAALWPQ